MHFLPTERAAHPGRIVYQGVDRAVRQQFGAGFEHFLAAAHAHKPVVCENGAAPQRLDGGGTVGSLHRD